MVYMPLACLTFSLVPIGVPASAAKAARAVTNGVGVKTPRPRSCPQGLPINSGPGPCERARANLSARASNAGPLPCAAPPIAGRTAGPLISHERAFMSARPKTPKPQTKIDTLPAGPGLPDTAELQAVALSALKAVAEDTDAPAAAKAAAARTLLEYTGGIGRHAEPPPSVSRTKPLSEMSLAELDAAIAAQDTV